SWLLRCDRVDFERGAVAPLHGHRGGGIRCLLRGRLDVTVGEGAMRAMRPWDAWFESGKEPVLAVACRDEETSLLRVSVLPPEGPGRPRRRTRRRSRGHLPPGPRGGSA